VFWTRQLGLGCSAEKVVAFDAYVAYFGTYTVDAAKQILVHHVEASLDPTYNGTDQARPSPLSATPSSSGMGALGAASSCAHGDRWAPQPRLCA
jgi:hypothetical protein